MSDLKLTEDERIVLSPIMDAARLWVIAETPEASNAAYAELMRVSLLALAEAWLYGWVSHIEWVEGRHRAADRPSRQLHRIAELVAARGKE